jgi:eukaryotic-like serine/threonine-protein kinase
MQSMFSLCLLFCVALSVAGCNLAAPEDQGDPAAVPAAAQPSELIKPVNVKSQLAWMPARAGGGALLSYCEQGHRSASNQPSLYLSSDRVGIAGGISICYTDFTPGKVHEQIIDPDGKTVRVADFTIDAPTKYQPTTFTSTDYVVFPSDRLGKYTIVANTPNGEFRTTFSAIEAFGIDSPQYPTVLVIGQGTNAYATRTAEYIAISGFAPNDTIDFAFYLYCEPDDRMKNVPVTVYKPNDYRQKDVIFHIYSIGVQIRVDNTGRALARIPQSIAQKLYSDAEYFIQANGTLPRLQPTSTSSENNTSTQKPSIASAWAYTRATPKVAAPICPVAADQLPALPTQSIETRASIWEYGDDIDNLGDLSAIGDNVFITSHNHLQALNRENGQPEWTHDLQAAGESAFIEGGGVFLVAKDGTITALDYTNGNPRWANQPASMTEDHIGKIAFLEGTVFRISTTLYAIDDATGQGRWNFVPAMPLRAGILAADGTVYVTGTDGELYALDIQTGQERWHVKAYDTAPALRITEVYPGTPAAAAGILPGDLLVELDHQRVQNVDLIHTIAVQNEGKSISALVKRNGKEERLTVIPQPWIAPDGTHFEVGYGFNGDEVGETIGSSYDPVIGDGIIYASSVDKDEGVYHLRAFNVTSGEMLWERHMEGFASVPEDNSLINPERELSGAPVAANDALYLISGKGELHALGAQTGQTQWVYSARAFPSYRPAAQDGMLYVGGTDGVLTALDGSSGQPLWIFQTESFVRTTPVIANDTLYLGASDGYLYTIDRASGIARWRAKTKRLSDIRHPPIVNAGSIYFTSQGSDIGANSDSNGRIYAIR